MDEAGVKQDLWVLFQQHSFLPNDTRVKTRRLSEQGFRAALRDCGTPSSLQRWFPLAVNNNKAQLARMEAYLKSERGQNDIWKSLQPSPTVATTNWSAFSAGMMDALGSIEARIQRIEREAEAEQQQQHHHHRSARFSVADDAAASKSTAANCAAVVQLLELSPLNNNDDADNNNNGYLFSRPAPTTAGEALCFSLPAAPLSEPGGPGGSSRTPSTAAVVSAAVSSTLSAAVARPSFQQQQIMVPTFRHGFEAPQKPVNSLGMPVLMQAPSGAQPQGSTPPSKPRKSSVTPGGPSAARHCFAAEEPAEVADRAATPPPTLRAPANHNYGAVYVTPGGAMRSVHETTQRGPASALTTSATANEAQRNRAPRTAPVPQRQQQQQQPDAALDGNYDEAYDARYNKQTNMRLRRQRSVECSECGGGPSTCSCTSASEPSPDSREDETMRHQQQQRRPVVMVASRCYEPCLASCTLPSSASAAAAVTMVAPPRAAAAVAQERYSVLKQLSDEIYAQPVRRRAQQPVYQPPPPLSPLQQQQQRPAASDAMVQSPQSGRNNNSPHSPQLFAVQKRDLAPCFNSGNNNNENENVHGQRVVTTLPVAERWHSPVRHRLPPKTAPQSNGAAVPLATITVNELFPNGAVPAPPKSLPRRAVAASGEPNAQKQDAAPSADVTTPSRSGSDTRPVAPTSRPVCAVALAQNSR